MKKITIISIVLISITLMNCEDNSLLPLPTQTYSSSFKGKVILENQTEYSNALVYVDSLNRGVSTDSSGNFTFIFNEKDSVYNGEFKIRYFLNDYDMDSAKIVLVNGKVRLDTLNIDSEGKIKTKELKQILRVEGWTDKLEYKIGEKITFTARFTNVTNREVSIFIQRSEGELGYVGLYNDKYIPFLLNGSCGIVHPAGGDMSLKPTLFYEGTVVLTIPDSYCGDKSKPLLIDEYIVNASLQIDGRLLNQFQSKFSKYVLEEWWKICRGNSPKYDAKPNKYNFPHIKIIK